MKMNRCRICGCEYVANKRGNGVCPQCHAEFKSRPKDCDDTVCDDCAKKLKWTWPEGHIATFWIGKCDFCQTVKSVCSTSDWRH